MKTAILTLPLHVNYGGILQAYALQTILTDMGHETIVLDWPTFISLPPFPERWLIYTRRYIGKVLHNSKSTVRWEAVQNERIASERRFTQPFIDTYINRRIISRPEGTDCRDIDAVIVGSDQVWRPKYFCPLWNTGIEDAFLRFTEGYKMKRIAYAASFGTETWEMDQLETESCSSLLQKFDAVSVRESSGIQLCRDYLGRTDAKRMPDPTFLLDKGHYTERFRIPEYPCSSGTLMCYVLDNDARSDKIIEGLEKSLKLKRFKVNSEVEDESADKGNRIQPPVEQWLRGFYDAELVITDSFHACVFAILFNKPFYVIGNEQRGLARIESLLSTMNLKQCIISDYDAAPTTLPTIDWQEVNAIVARERKRGISFLINSLDETNQCQPYQS